MNNKGSLWGGRLTVDCYSQGRSSSINELVV